ncbi:alginate lyase family protein [Janibacter melonis]|uniref:heparinase II/III domain-containing protein n=1 Tax=Janibacter melonis TaxID=262209 RepID=UPI001786F613|nr:hypothetical protein [Janibacter melonis]
MSRRAQVGRLVRTFRYLEPQQVLSRAREPLVDLVDSSGPRSGAPVTAPGWPSTFSSTDSLLRAGGLGFEGEDITLLGENRTMGPPAEWDWTAPGASRLWRFHLNYWDWAHETLTHAGGAGLLEELVTGWWGRTRYGQGDEWEPYVVSLRLWSLCGLWNRDFSPVGHATIISAVSTQQHYLSRRLEWDVRGNHLIKNLKALCGAAAFLGERDRFSDEIDRAHNEISRQVLRDGGHEERSPSYHAQVLLDVIDLRDLARAMGETAAADSFSELAAAMTAWLCSMSPGDVLPAVNDGFPPSHEVLDLLLPGDRPPAPTVTVLGHSGYARVKTGEWEHLLDVGPIGPPHNPGHGHADSLSFLSWYSGVPVLVDTGTSTYDAGTQRAYERSTRAHNTVEVGSRDSSEVWKSFRVGRRATASLDSLDVMGDRVTVSASHDGYQVSHQVSVCRTWDLGPEGLQITDRLQGRDVDDKTTVLTHLHLHPDLVWDGSRASSSADAFTVTCQDETGELLSAEVRLSPVATGLNRVQEAVHLTFRWPAGSRSISVTIDHCTPIKKKEDKP